MTRDEIIKLAREAGAGIGTSGRWLVTQEELERFAALVAAAEREACAQMVMPLDESLADEIRARGEMK